MNGSSKRTPTLDVVSILDCKRVELERGEGGDHDLPYHFAFPAMWPQARAWTELLVLVQLGDTGLWERNGGCQRTVVYLNFLPSGPLKLVCWR